jgi:hypothetical protein
MMLVPDPREASREVLSRLRKSLKRMTERNTRNLPDEFDLTDRQELDDAVFELLGEASPAKRKELHERLYHEMRELYKAIREKELLAIENKKKANRSKRKSGVLQLADEILNELGPDLVRHFPADFIQSAWKTETVSLRPGRARIKDHGLLGEHGIDIGGHYIELGHPERAQFAKVLSDLGRQGEQPIPLEPEHCRQALSAFRDYREQFHAELVERAGQKTTDARIQARVVKMVEARIALSM